MDRLVYAPGITNSHNNLAFVVDEETIELMKDYRDNVDNKNIIPLLIDHHRYDHNGSVEAVGKGRVEFDLENGIIVKDIELNDLGKNKADKYFYTSAGMGVKPVLNEEGEDMFDDDGRQLVRPLFLEELSLTNFPATTNMQPFEYVTETKGDKKYLKIKSGMHWIKTNETIQGKQENMVTKENEQADLAELVKQLKDELEVYKKDLEELKSKQAEDPEDDDVGDDSEDDDMTKDEKKELENLRKQIAEMKAKEASVEKEKFIKELTEKNLIGEATAKLYENLELDAVKALHEARLNDKIEPSANNKHFAINENLASVDGYKSKGARNIANFLKVSQSNRKGSK